MSRDFTCMRDPHWMSLNKMQSAHRDIGGRQRRVENQEKGWKRREIPLWQQDNL